MLLILSHKQKAIGEEDTFYGWFPQPSYADARHRIASARLRLLLFSIL